MRIAVTYENGNIFQHFGHTEHFKVYDIENGEIAVSSIMSTNGSGHSALASILKKGDIDKLICGGIGAGAKNALAAAGIELYGGVSGNADEQVKALLRGELEYNSAAECGHHHSHGCSEHDDHCGGHC